MRQVLDVDGVGMTLVVDRVKGRVYMYEQYRVEGQVNY